MEAREFKIGLKPRRIHEGERVVAISEAIIRYVKSNKNPPSEWIEELNLYLKP